MGTHHQRRQTTQPRIRNPLHDNAPAPIEVIVEKLIQRHKKRSGRRALKSSEVLKEKTTGMKRKAGKY